jgi:ribonuclease HII
MILPTCDYEMPYWQQGLTVVGIDEVGRGAWAGPVVAGAVILRTDTVLPALLRDSKMLSARQRQIVDRELRLQIPAWATGEASAAEIDTIGIAPATFLAMTRAVQNLPCPIDRYLIDGFAHPEFPRHQQQHIVKGDAKVASIAAASVLAKVYRDHIMSLLDEQFSSYGFGQHKGYGTKQHCLAIRQSGFTCQHRKSFAITV